MPSHQRATAAGGPGCRPAGRCDQHQPNRNAGIAGPTTKDTDEAHSKAGDTGAPGRRHLGGARRRSLDRSRRVESSGGTPHHRGSRCRPHGRLRVREPGQEGHDHPHRQRQPVRAAGGRPELPQVRRRRALPAERRQRRRFGGRPRVPVHLPDLDGQPEHVPLQHRPVHVPQRRRPERQAGLRRRRGEQRHRQADDARHQPPGGPGQRRPPVQPRLREEPRPQGRAVDRRRHHGVRRPA